MAASALLLQFQNNNKQKKNKNSLLKNSANSKKIF